MPFYPFSAKREIEKLEERFRVEQKRRIKLEKSLKSLVKKIILNRDVSPSIFEWAAETKEEMGW